MYTGRELFLPQCNSIFTVFKDKEIETISVGWKVVRDQSKNHEWRWLFRKENLMCRPERYFRGEKQHRRRRINSMSLLSMSSFRSALFSTRLSTICAYKYFTKARKKTLFSCRQALSPPFIRRDLRRTESDYYLQHGFHSFDNEKYFYHSKTVSSNIFHPETFLNKIYSWIQDAWINNWFILLCMKMQACLN